MRSGCPRWLFRASATGILLAALALLLALIWLPPLAVEHAIRGAAAGAGLQLEAVEVEAASLRALRVARVSGKVHGSAFELRGIVLSLHPRGSLGFWAVTAEEVSVQWTPSGSDGSRDVRAPRLPRLGLLRAHVERALVQLRFGERGTVPVVARGLRAVPSSEGGLEIAADLDTPGAAGVLRAHWDDAGVRDLKLDFRVEASSAARSLVLGLPEDAPTVEDGVLEGVLRGALSAEGALCYGVVVRSDDLRVKWGAAELQWRAGALQIQGDEAGVRGVEADGLDVACHLRAVSAVFRGRVQMRAQNSVWRSEGEGSFVVQSGEKRVAGELALNAESGQETQATVAVNGLEGAGLPIQPPRTLSAELRLGETSWEAELAPFVLLGTGVQGEFSAVRLSSSEPGLAVVEAQLRVVHSAVYEPVEASLRIESRWGDGRRALLGRMEVPPQRVEARFDGGTVAVHLDAGTAEVRLADSWLVAARVPWRGAEAVVGATRIASGAGEGVFELRFPADADAGEGAGIVLSLTGSGLCAERGEWRVENGRFSLGAEQALDAELGRLRGWNAELDGLRVRRLPDEAVFLNRGRLRVTGGSEGVHLEGSVFVRGTDLQPGLRGTVRWDAEAPVWSVRVDLPRSALLDWGALAEWEPRLTAWEVSGHVEGHVLVSRQGDRWSVQADSNGGPLRLRATDGSAQWTGVGWEVAVEVDSSGANRARGQLIWEGGTLARWTVGPGALPFELLAGVLSLGESRVEAFGGRFVGEPVRVDLARAEASGQVRVEGVDLGVLLEALPDASLVGEGRLSGLLLYAWHRSGGVVRGELFPGDGGARVSLPFGTGWLGAPKDDAGGKIRERIERALGRLRVRRVAVDALVQRSGANRTSLRLDGEADATDVRAPVTLEVRYTDALGAVPGLFGAR